MENKVKVNTKEFLSKYNENYNYLYNTEDTQYNEYINIFDNEMKKNEDFKKMVIDFAKYRGDYLTSDRECIAFIMTLKERENL